MEYLKQAILIVLLEHPLQKGSYLHRVQLHVLTVVRRVRRSVSAPPGRLVSLMRGGQRGRGSRGGQDGLLHRGALPLLQDQRV